MDITLEGQVGIVNYPDGSDARERVARDGSVILARGHCDLFEVASRGMLFTATDAVGGNAHGTAFGATPATALANPINNSMALVISHANFGYVSGTLGIGAYNWGQQAGVAAAGFVATVQQARVYGNQLRGASTGLFYIQTNLTNTATVLRPSLSYGAFAGGAARLTLLRDDVRGELIVMPGATVVLQGIGTGGSTPKVITSISWYEVPLSMVS